MRKHYPVPARSAPRLDSRQRTFVRAVARGVDVLVAARDAGFSLPESDAYELLRSAPVARALNDEIRALLLFQSTPVALRTLDSIVSGDHFPAGARVMAARLILDRAGFVAPVAARARDDLDRDPTELTTDELRDMVRELSAELGDRATPVNEPIRPVGHSYLSDLLD